VWLCLAIADAVGGFDFPAHGASGIVLSPHQPVRCALRSQDVLRLCIPEFRPGCEESHDHSVAVNYHPIIHRPSSYVISQHPPRHPSAPFTTTYAYVRPFHQNTATVSAHQHMAVDSERTTCMRTGLALPERAASRGYLKILISGFEVEVCRDLG